MKRFNLFTTALLTLLVSTGAMATNYGSGCGVSGVITVGGSTGQTQYAGTATSEADAAGGSGAQSSNQGNGKTTQYSTNSDQAASSAHVSYAAQGVVTSASGSNTAYAQSAGHSSGNGVGSTSGSAGGDYSSKANGAYAAETYGQSTTVYGSIGVSTYHY